MKLQEALSGLDNLYCELLREWFSARPDCGALHRRQIFISPVVCFLCIQQKVIGRNSLSSAVQHLQQEMSETSLLKFYGPRFGIDVSSISSSNAALCKARANLSNELVEGVFQEIKEQLSKINRKELSVGRDPRWYLLDGTTIGLENTKSIKEEFPPIKNQNGECAPYARVVVAHNLFSGVAELPAIGKSTESEQKLSKEIIQGLPKGSGIIADKNFGVFSVVYNAQQQGVKALVRLTKARAQKIRGKEKLKDGVYNMTWTPSKKDRTTNPEIEESASLKGKLIIGTSEAKGLRAEQFYFFTTANLEPDEALEIYLRRYLVENDIRTLKKTVNLDEVYAKNPDTARKEILFGVIAYNLFRALITKAAVHVGLLPRDISFTRAVEQIQGTAKRLTRATTLKETRKELENFYRHIRQIRHPKRKKTRVEPRALAKTRKARFPTIKGSRDEERENILKG